MVDFRQWNLLNDPQQLGTFDIIFCRNVLIYFDVPTKRWVLVAMWSHLAPGGWLYLGGAETTFGMSEGFGPYPGTHQIYTAVPR
jgi:chemotaxis protein methyltransferase CheR